MTVAQAPGLAEPLASTRLRIAITGGTGFVGGHVAAVLRAGGHDVVIVGRRAGVDVTDVEALQTAFAGCDAVVHCAGINRELGRQTYRRVHVDGTAAVVEVARATGVQRIVLLSFLRARPDGPSDYHRSKWDAEELVRGSGLEWTVLKAGVIFGRGDHLVDHVSRALRTVPVFGLVGPRGTPMRPVAVADVARVLASAATGDRRLVRRTVAVLGPDLMTLGDVVSRIGDAVGVRPVLVPLPIAIHRMFARLWEAAMLVPLASRAQVEILAESLSDPLPFAADLPRDLQPTTPFTRSTIASALPNARRFGLRDLRCGW